MLTTAMTISTAYLSSRSVRRFTAAGCKRKIKTFETAGPLNKHLKDHVKDLWCFKPNCNEAFARISDLDRHIRAKHSKDRRHPCPIETCDRHANGFARKDHLDRHTRKEHPNFRCGFHHCGAQVLECEIEDHITFGHGCYECSLPGCESTTSKFTYKSAQKHLRAHHRINTYSAYPENLNVSMRSGDGALVMVRPTGRWSLVGPCNNCTKSKTGNNTSNNVPA
jgi:hypothetical protein